MKVTIPPEMEVKEIIARYGVHRATAYRAKKRGYLIVGYHEKEVVIDDGVASSFSWQKAYDIARAMFHKHFSFYEGSLEHYEDCLQEGVTRLLELTGHRDFHKTRFQCAVVCNAMRDYLVQWGILRARKKYLDSKEEYQSLQEREAI